MSESHRTLWIPVHVSLKNHPKLLGFCRVLWGKTTSFRLRAATGYLINLWLWTMQYYSDGNLIDVTEEQIEFACDWEGKPGAFVQALESSGFISKNGSGNWYVHDWEDYGGKVYRQRKKNAEYQARHRERKHDVRLTSALRKHNVRGVEGDIDIDKSKERKKKERKKHTGILTNAQQERFDRWYRVYPRHKASGDAEKAWKKLDPDDEFTNELIRAVEQQKEWRKKAKDPPPWRYPATWLNAKCWSDGPDDDDSTHASYEMPDGYVPEEADDNLALFEGTP